MPRKAEIADPNFDLRIPSWGEIRRMTARNAVANERNAAAIERNAAAIERNTANIDSLRASINALGVKVGEVTAAVNADIEKRAKDERLKDLSVQMADTITTVRALNQDHAKTRRRIEEAEASRGRAAEFLFHSDFQRVMEEDAGFALENLSRLRIKTNGREYDFFADGWETTGWRKVAIVAEVKSRFRASHLDRLRELARSLRGDFPDLIEDSAVYAAAAGMSVDRDAADIARKEGIFVLVPESKTRLKLKGEGKFRPREF